MMALLGADAILGQMGTIGAGINESHNNVDNEEAAGENGKARGLFALCKATNARESAQRHLQELFEHHRLELIDAKGLRQESHIITHNRKGSRWRQRLCASRINCAPALIGSKVTLWHAAYDEGAGFHVNSCECVRVALYDDRPPFEKGAGVHACVAGDDDCSAAHQNTRAEIDIAVDLDIRVARTASASGISYDRIGRAKVPG
jgi:hypothetical protein